MNTFVNRSAACQSKDDNFGACFVALLARISGMRYNGGELSRGVAQSG